MVPWRERNPGKEPKCAFHVQLYINMPLEFVKIALLTEVRNRFNPNNTKKSGIINGSQFSENDELLVKNDPSKGMKFNGINYMPASSKFMTMIHNSQSG